MFQIFYETSTGFIWYAAMPNQWWQQMMKVPCAQWLWWGLNNHLFDAFIAVVEKEASMKWWQDSASGGSCWFNWEVQLGLYVLAESIKLIKSIMFGILIVALISKSILHNAIIWVGQVGNMKSVLCNNVNLGLAYSSWVDCGMIWVW